MQVNIYKTVKKVGLSTKTIQHIVNITAKKVKKHGQISVHAIANTKMTRLNQQYRKKQGTTDVLTFASVQEGMAFPFEKNKQEPIDYGDIFISIPQIKKQAKQHKISFREEFTRMLVHGVLHSFGYDHIQKKDEKVMIPLQESIVQKLCK